jgi:hypothetical protein
MPKLPWHPRVTQPGRLGDHPELPPHIVIILRSPDRRHEHQPVILPQPPARQPVLSLPHPMLPQRLHAPARQRQRPAGLRRLRIAPGPVGPPHEHRQLLVIEPGIQRRNPLTLHSGHDVIPPQRPDLLGPQPRQQRQGDVSLQPRPRAAASKDTACSKVSDLDGRPAPRPFGGLTSAATFRPTRSSRSDYRIARTSTLCAICTVRVDSRDASTPSAPCEAP